MKSVIVSAVLGFIGGAIGGWIRIGIMEGDWSWPYDALVDLWDRF